MNKLSDLKQHPLLAQSCIGQKCGRFGWVLCEGSHKAEIKVLVDGLLSADSENNLYIQPEAHC